MWIFKKKEPPPPQPKVPAWVIQLITPIMMTIVLGLVAFIGNGFTESLKDVKTQVEKVDERKVDNDTLRLMIENQNIVIQHQQQEAEKQRQDDAKKFDEIQKTQTKTLERIEAVQTQRAVNYKEPEKFELEKDLLTPEEFEIYMQMQAEVRKKYKQYLEQKGRDVSCLPD